MNSSDGGVGVLKRMGVDESFLRDMQKRYGGYASMVGLNGDTVKNTIGAISKAIDSKPPQAPNKSSLDISKYPKL